MGNKVNFDVLKNIERVYNKTLSSRLKSSSFNKIDKELSNLSAYFKVTKIQALFISVIFTKHYERHSSDINDLADHFECSVIKILRYIKEIKAVMSKGIIEEDPRISLGGSNEISFKVKGEVVGQIINNEVFTEVKRDDKFDNMIDVLERIYNLGEIREHDTISTQELLFNTMMILNSNKDISFLNKVNLMNIKMANKYFYLYLIWETLNGNKSVDIERIPSVIFDKPAKKIRYMQEILSEENALIKSKLIEIEKANFINDAEVMLSGYSLDLLKEEGIQIFIKKKKPNNIIKPEKIKLKQLFYNKEENEQVSVLQKMLSETKLKEIQERLSEKKLPEGITVLLYGLPGTGKTETVYQIAKSTGREIFKVEISQSKSMWFGESEKKIKRIFTDYKDYAKECELTPVLLFNEADAIISKRKEVNSSNVSQTENTIQNIILEELENFEGIFFATTNLVGNLDTAFERRFLFKIEFNKPNISVKEKIWKSKLSKLSASDCKRLANQFDFSGGQIDNIVRKYEVHEIINGENAAISDIIGFCEKEKLAKNNKTKVGFVKV